jgi:predicted RND superfamily exporter protein
LLEEARLREKLDYRQVAEKLETIRTEFEDDEYTVHLIGFAKIVGDISDGAKAVAWFFVIAFIVTAILMYLLFRSVWLSFLPSALLLVAVIWQIGIISLLGYSLDR